MIDFEEKNENIDVLISVLHLYRASVLLKHHDLNLSNGVLQLASNILSTMTDYDLNDIDRTIDIIDLIKTNE